MIWLKKVKIGAVQKKPKEGAQNAANIIFKVLNTPYPILKCWEGASTYEMGYAYAVIRLHENPSVSFHRNY